MFKDKNALVILMKISKYVYMVNMGLFVMEVEVLVFTLNMEVFVTQKKKKNK